MDSEASDSDTDSLPDLPAVPSAASLLNAEFAKHPRGFHLCHLNAESVLAHLDDIVDLMYSKSCHALCVSESFLKPTLPDNLVHIAGYKIFRNDRVGKGGGGVAIYIRDDLRGKIIYNSDPNYSSKPEILLVEIVSDQSKVLVGVIYKPPNAGNLGDIEDVLGSYCSGYEKLILVGDFNTNVQRDSNAVRQLKSIFDAFALDILHTGPTCHVQRGDIDSHTTLDLMVTKKDKVSNHGQISTPHISIHDLIYLSYSLKSKRYKPRLITYRDLKNIDQQLLNRSAEGVGWGEVLVETELDEKVTKFNKLLLNLYDTLAPLQTKRATRPAAPWMNERIQRLRKERDVAMRNWKRDNTTASKTIYKKTRNKLSQEIRNAKMKLIRQHTSNFGDKKTWREIKKLGLGKQTENDVEIDTDLDQLNRYFCNLGGRVDDNTRTRTKRDIASRATQHDFLPFTLKPVTEDDTREAFKTIKTNAAGCDNISIQLITKIFDTVLPVLTDIFNCSLRSGQFPSLWKDSYVTPLPKVKSPTLMTEFRPINITSILSKALEKLVLRQMTDYLKENSLLDELQSAYKPKHSTMTALLKISEDIRQAMDDKKLTIIVLLDCSAAFNSVDFDILLTKLKHYFNFSNSSLSWMNSYLTNRRQQVKIKTGNSEWETLDRSVPPGTVLGPVLFTLYTQDLTKILHQNINYHSYSDDIQIYSHCKLHDLQTTTQDFTRQLQTIFGWATDNGISLNAKKTQAMLIGSERLINKINFSNVQKLRINNTEVQFVNNVKNLGIYFDQFFTWKNQVQHTCKKVYGCLHSLRRMKNFLTFDSKRRLVQSLIWPHIDYCDVVQLNATADQVARLQKCLNSCVRFIYNLKRDERITPYFKQLGWLKVIERRKLRTAVEIYKILSTNTPTYLASSFSYLSHFHDINTRSGTKLSIPRHLTDFRHKSFAVSGARLWNTIPEQIRSKKTVQSFRQAYQEHLVRMVCD